MLDLFMDKELKLFEVLWAAYLVLSHKTFDNRHFKLISVD